MPTIAKVRFPATGASNRTISDKLQEFVSVKDFGAVGNGTTDDTAAFAAAISAASNIFIPAGTYLVNLDFTGVRGKTLLGAGRDVVTLKNWSDSAVIRLDNTTADCKMNHFEGFRIQNRDEATYTAADGIYITGVGGNENDFHTFNRLEILDMRYGIHMDKRTIWNTFEDVHVYSCINDGLYVNTTDNISAQNFVQCRFGQNGRNGIWVTKNAGDLLSSWTFSNVTFEKNESVGVRVSGTASGINAWTFSNCYFEENTRSLAAAATNPRKANVFIESQYALGVTFESNALFGTPLTTQLDWGIYIDAACIYSNGFLGANRFGTTVEGAYRVTNNWLIAPQFAAGGTPVADRSAGNFVVADFTGSSGTFTPTVTFGGASVGQTYSNQIGRWARHGNLLQVSGYVSFTNKGSSTGSAAITGLPVATLNATNFIQSVAVSGDQFGSSVGNLVGRVQPNSTQITLHRMATGSLSAVSDADFGNFSALSFSATLVLL